MPVYSSATDDTIRHLLTTFDDSELRRVPAHVDVVREIADAIRIAWPDGRPPSVDEIGAGLAQHHIDSGDLIAVEPWHDDWQAPDHTPELGPHHDGDDPTAGHHHDTWI